jgi:hypothetical protein
VCGAVFKKVVFEVPSPNWCPQLSPVEAKVKAVAERDVNLHKPTSYGSLRGSWE